MTSTGFTFNSLAKCSSIDSINSSLFAIKGRFFCLSKPKKYWYRRSVPNDNLSSLIPQVSTYFLLYSGFTFFGGLGGI